MHKRDLQDIIESKSPDFFNRLPKPLSAGLLRVLERIVHADELLDFFDQHGEKYNQAFIEAVFTYLDFGYVVAEEALRSIPETGRLICVANHGNGPLDGLILLHLIGRVRPDVKIVVSDLLAGLDNLRDLFLLYDQYSPRLQKQNISAIRRALLDEQAVIFFPAGEVTKLSWHGIRETTWQPGAFSLARKYAVPILPVAIRTRNSPLYYCASRLYRHFSTLLLSHEMFRQRSRRTPVLPGEIVRLTDVRDDFDAQIQALRRTVQQLVSVPQ